MAGKKINIAEVTADIARPAAQALGLTLWDTVFVKEGTGWFLRITIDKPGGIFIEDCEKLSRAIDPMIDALPIEQEYCLEVTSPGLSRALRTEAHLEAYLGREIKLKLYKDAGQGREFFGQLAAFDIDALVLKTENDKVTFKRAEIAHVWADDDKDLF